MKLPKQYNSKESEKKWRAHWEKKKTYAFDPNSKSEIYSIDTPPPTVSGKMHIGHAFSYAQQDFVVRYKRMRGFNIFYPFGTDDNGLATERLIEKMKNVKATKMDRQEFINLCLTTLDKELRFKYVQDWKNIGMSCDWDVFYTTIDDNSRRISQKYFLDLIKKKRAYRKFSPVIFCPHCKTSIAQVEMEDKEKEATLDYIKGKLETGEFIIYATTRPELHPSCVGISLDEKGDYVTVKRPDGEKWVISKDAVEKMKQEFPMKIESEYKGKHLVGKRVDIEFALGPVMVSHDTSAKTEYGTGIVYYCTYGGLDCVEWIARHPKVNPVHTMDETGVYTKGPYKGMDSNEARKKVSEDLDKKGLLIKQEKMQHVLNVHERCGIPIEYVALEQWFIKYLDLKPELLRRGKQLNWYPKHMINRYENWIKGLQWDWCISRQRFSGVPFPVWYDKKTGEPIFADEKQLPVDPLKDLPKGYKRAEVIAEKDILDTWATSSLTPHLAADLFKDHPVYKKLLPMNLRPQAHDIITFWLFNTVVRSNFHDNDIPWKDVMISGWALDPHGRKMSKSKGNVVEPQVMMEKYGADALRFWAAGSKLGDDLPFQEKDLVTGHKFATKLWNASKFSLMHLEKYKGEKPKKIEKIDSWILNKLNKIIKVSTESFDKYEYNKTKLETEKFFWHDFADNYLEIIKDRLYNPEKYSKENILSAKYTLYTTILTCLKLIAPIMPFISEEIYNLYFNKIDGSKSIHTSRWPEFDKGLVNKKDEEMGDVFVMIVGAVRKFKSEKNLALREPIKVLTIETKHEKSVKDMTKDLIGVTKAENIEFGKGNIEVSEELKISIDL